MTTAVQIPNASLERDPQLVGGAGRLHHLAEAGTARHLAPGLRGARPGRQAPGAELVKATDIRAPELVTQRPLETSRGISEHAGRHREPGRGIGVMPARACNRQASAATVGNVSVTASGPAAGRSSAASILRRVHA